MSEYNEHTEQLIAAALAGDLTAEERAELDSLRAQDPSIDETLEEFGQMLPALNTAGREWKESQPPVHLDSSIALIPYDDAGHTDSEPAKPHLSRRPAWLALAAAGGLILGTGGTLVTQGILDAPPDGPPGTYGAVEDITFTGESEGVSVEGDLIAHTWGTETVLEIDGVEPGQSFAVVLIAEDGEEFASGTFIGSEILIECRMNAAVMRDEVERVEITTAEGDLIASADLPAAIDPEDDDPEELDAAFTGQE